MSPSPLICHVTILPQIFTPETAAELARHLAPVHEAQEGDLIALNPAFSDAYGGPYRCNATAFVVKDGDVLIECTYSELSAKQKAVAAHLELVLQSDGAFENAVAGEFPEMRDAEEDATYYSVYVVSGAVGIVNLETDRAELSGRSQEDLASFCRLVLPLASSAHEAMARHDDLRCLMLFWRWVLTEHAEADLPKMLDPTVDQLLTLSVTEWK